LGKFNILILSYGVLTSLTYGKNKVVARIKDLCRLINSKKGKIK